MLELLKNRRSIRKYKSDKLKPEEIKQLLKDMYSSIDIYSDGSMTSGRCKDC